ncbi:hypothetical protein V6N11_041643 [Hibiscus sabdariffa]|uniref:Uncharacterized protein n=1 Tax=Hibiscus sabdariffa TaxID=183260 RepID=A0ABR2RLS5_9ROSI
MSFLCFRLSTQELIPSFLRIKRRGSDDGFGFVKVDGKLMPPDGPDLWPKNNGKRQWLVFYRINEMSLQGGGVINGRGGSQGISIGSLD